ncbi:G-type lectin S-receptor-like serine/threonine-protein kinase At4g03230 isoform X2 [Manihot esculenta]|uniref:G-type lectin S-receptor-like serine/threonine-protein kinase At4g03230 isoform X2 n=1 Tax=Manihot esculenta TaxID=3983 RepID=UPI000B5D128C|nr:G-type lectin S-receptor-like serine/threonine-protein kinase At4g03230 isoform X2 [Manihot esculenta]
MLPTIALDTIYTKKQRPEEKSASFSCMISCNVILCSSDDSPKMIYSPMLLNTILFSCVFIFCSSLLNSFARQNISVHNPLNDGETLVSAGEEFELGFFTPAGSVDNKRYLGIWYYGLNPRTVIWVANRNHPLPDTGGRFAVDDGNLNVLDESGKVVWSTDLGPPSPRYYWVATLLDSGNLVFSNRSVTIWQSFKNPTDTFLSGMKMDKEIRLTSWISELDPSPGKFKFSQEDKDQFIIRNGSIPYWGSGVSGEFFRAELDIKVAYLLSNFDKKIWPFGSKHIPNSYYNKTRIVMNFTGQLQYWSLDNQNNWSLEWSEPKDRCSALEACGRFASCNNNNNIACKCLPGFKPLYPEDWKDGDFSGGCTRTSTSCEKNDIFLNLTMMKVSDTKSKSEFKNETECREECLSKCLCKAYSYTQDKNSFPRSPTFSNSTCWIWTEDLRNLQEEYPNGHELFVRVARSDIESTGRNCEPCGTSLIPYPLSTGSNCGDPMYLNFYCDNSTGELKFKASTGTYNVTSVNPNTRTFVIQAIEARSCYARNSAVLELDPSLPYKINCSNEVDNAGNKISSEGIDEIKISWDTPPEPSCNSSADCKDWPYSTCNVTAEGMRRCLCHANFRWDGSALNCTIEDRTYPTPIIGSSKRKTKLFFIIGITIASLIVLASAIAYIYIRKGRMKKRQETEKIGRDAVLLYGTEKRVKDLIGSEEFKEEDKKGIDVPFFNLDSILAATDNFSEANKLGRGGFGPVYKGIFPGGQEIAIKRLSSVSVQGLEEFKNEVVLIARLQHRNLVKLLGYCIHRNEKILLYEYMPNKSLDSFLFDAELAILLNWEVRFNIIMGVARGLVYLHQDSRLRIIHRDLKTSNILLDAEMNPKISDFGLARIFEGKQTEGNTNRVVGTYGYMSPEYALDGIFSVKSDAFSFGVVVLEILSGRRSTGVFRLEQGENLLSYAWRLWKEQKALDFMDKTISESCKSNEFLKCLCIALLCIQEDPADRPTMSNVLTMLSGETATFSTPKQPAFFEREGIADAASSSSSSKHEISTMWTTSLGGG